ncbi:hypothetical protein Tco_0226877 [Tanacetum coccineum]
MLYPKTVSFDLASPSRIKTIYTSAQQTSHPIVSSCVFGALATQLNDSRDLGQVTTKAAHWYFHWLCTTKESNFVIYNIYNRRTRRIIETIHVDFDELTAMASEHRSSGPVLQDMTPATISSGLVPNPPSSTPFVPPSRSEWDSLFQPMFDELFNSLSYVDLPAPEVIAPILKVVAPKPAVSIGSPSSTTVDQDAPSPNISQTTPENPSLVISNDVEEDNHDIEVAHMGNDPYFGIPILKKNPLGPIENMDDPCFEIINKFSLPLKRQISESEITRFSSKKFDELL